MEAINIPCLPAEENGGAKRCQDKLEILYKLSSALGGRIYGRPNNLPISIFVLKELAAMDAPDLISEFKDLFNAVKEAAFALSDRNTAIEERRRKEQFRLFPYEETKGWFKEKSRIIQFMNAHGEAVKNIQDTELMCFGTYQKSKTTLPVCKKGCTYVEENLLMKRYIHLWTEGRIRAKISEFLLLKLPIYKESLVSSIEAKIKNILMMLRKVTNLNEKHIIKVDPSGLSRRLLEVTSWTYKTQLVNIEDFPPFSISMMTPQLEKGVYSALCRLAELNFGINSSAIITYEHTNMSVKSSESLYIQNGSWTSCRQARRIKQKLVSKDAKRAFGWTSSNLLSPKRWVLYSMSNIQKIY